MTLAHEMKKMKRKRGKRKGILLHHWDTDGICSCAILMKELPKEGGDLEWSFMTPVLGNYYLNEQELGMFREDGPSEVIIADMAIPSDQVEMISGWVERVRHFDHHLQRPHDLDNVEHINPVAESKDWTLYPSCTFVLMEHFGRDLDLPTVLGVVGDLDRRLFRYRDILEQVEGYMRSHGLSFHDLMRMVDLIDSNYKTNDRAGVRDAIQVLARAEHDPGAILSRTDWVMRSSSIEGEVRRCMSAPIERVGGKAILRIDTTYHIISSIGRKASAQQMGPTVVVNTGLKDMDQVYARGSDMTGAIEYAQGLGLRAGGKKDVLGAIMEKGRLEEVLPGLLDRIPKEVL